MTANTIYSSSSTLLTTYQTIIDSQRSNTSNKNNSNSNNLVIKKNDRESSTMDPKCNKIRLYEVEELVVIKKENKEQNKMKLISTTDSQFNKYDHSKLYSKNKKQLIILDDYSNEKIIKPILKKSNILSKKFVIENCEKVNECGSTFDDKFISNKKSVKFIDQELKINNIDSNFTRNNLAEIINVESYKQFFKCSNTNDSIENDGKSVNIKCRCQCIVI